MDGVMIGIADPFLQSRYLGFVVLSAVTVFELAIKDVFIEFAEKKHVVLGNVIRSKFEQINGRIRISSLQNEFIKPFGAKYLERFNKNLENAEVESLRSRNGSIKSSYGNIIQWRHDFVHQARAPQTTNYVEVKAAYHRAKGVIHCLDKTMKR
nr:HEPN domain-containing protein [Sphingomonas vulcanisoli]